MSLISITLPEPKENGIIKFDDTEQSIAELKHQYMQLKIKDIHDREGEKAVHSARMIAKNKRILIQNRIKELTAKPKKEIEQIKETGNFLIDLLSPIENYLENEETRIEKERETLKKEAEAREQKRIQDRINQLFGYGFAIDFNEIRTMTDIAFNDLLEQARIEHEKDLQAKEDAKKLAEAQAAQLLTERRELEELRQQQALIAKEQNEKEEELRKQREAFADAKFKERKSKLLSLSMTEGELNITYKNLLNIPRTKLYGMSDEEWETVYKNASDVISQLKDEDEKAKQKEIEQEKEGARLNEKLAKEREAALLPDKEKIKAFAQMLSELKYPEVNDLAAKSIVNLSKEKITDVINNLNKYDYRKTF